MGGNRSVVPACQFPSCRNNMPDRDENGRFCGCLYIRESNGSYNLRYFVLDEGLCLLRYFDRNKSVRNDAVVI